MNGFDHRIFAMLKQQRERPENSGLNGDSNRGACFSKVPRTFRARKAIRKTTTCLFCNAGPFICCKGNKNKNNWKVSCLETPPLKIQRELCHPKYAQKVSGLLRNRSFSFFFPSFFSSFMFQ